MPNHFHFLVRLKEDVKDNIIIPDRLTCNCHNKRARYNKKPHQYFSNVFNAYTKGFNLQENRHDPLFEKPLRRKPTNSKNYLIQALLYIHNNPTP